MAELLRKGFKKGDVFKDGDRLFEVVEVQKDGNYISKCLELTFAAGKSVKKGSGKTGVKKETTEKAQAAEEEKE